MKIFDFSNDEIAEFHTMVMNNIKAARKEKSLSQLDLSHLIGHKSVSIISKVEGGLEGKHYNIEQIYKIAKVLDVDVSDLLKKK